MDSLPQELIELVASKLETRPLCAFACVGRRFREAAATVTGLSVCCTVTSDADEWVQRPDVSPRIASLAYRRTIPPVDMSAFSMLRSLSILFTAIDARLVHSLPKTLEHVILHRLYILRPEDANLRYLTQLPNLKTIDLTFDSPHAVLIVRDNNSSVERLRLRGCGIVRVDNLPPSLTHLELSAFDIVGLPPDQQLPRTLESLDVQSRYWSHGWNRDIKLPASLRSLTLRATDDALWPLPDLSAATRLNFAHIEGEMVMLESADVRALLKTSNHIVQSKTFPILLDATDEEVWALLLKLRWIVARPVAPATEP